MLDGKEEWMIDFHFNWLRWAHQDAPLTMATAVAARGFGAFFIHADECFVKHIGDGEIIIRSARSHPIEIRAARWNIERAVHAEFLQAPHPAAMWAAPF